MSGDNTPCTLTLTRKQISELHSLLEDERQYFAQLSWDLPTREERRKAEAECARIDRIQDKVAWAYTNSFPQTTY